MKFATGWGAMRVVCCSDLDTAIAEVRLASANSDLKVIVVGHTPGTWGARRLPTQLRDFAAWRSQNL